jgi:NAD(P)-dependent dehydrogenase (short-subunit alcohol dehydrogenase family)
MAQLEGRVAIVTGAGGGLGRAHALYLASHGAKLVVNDMSAENAEKVAAEIAGAGGDAIAAPGSVTDEATVAAMVAGAIGKWGAVDILVNNAGILRDKSFAKMPLDDFRLVLEVHLMGAAICTKAVWDHMRERGYGRIVMTTSSSGLYGNFGQANYGAAKMALVGLMQTLAIEGAKHNIKVNCLAPSAATGMTHDIFSARGLELLAPDKVSPALLALVGENAPTRTILCAGGGHFAAANVTLTKGYDADQADDAGEDVIRHWNEVTDRRNEIVPEFGFVQVEREVAGAGLTAAEAFVQR